MKNTTMRPRSGATAVEFALVSPVLLLLLLGLVIGGVGIFRYNQVAQLAREGARYASVHGLDYERETGLPAATQASIFNDVILANAVGLSPSQLSCTVTWNRSNLSRTFLPDKTTVANIVTVTVSYQWMPEAFLGGITLSSTSKMPMAF